MSDKYLKKTKEAAQKAVDELDERIRWIRENVKIGSKVKFKGSRSTRWNKNVYREVLEFRSNSEDSPNFKYRRGYLNPDYVEFETKFKYNTPEYKEAREKYEALPKIQRTYIIYLSSKENQIDIVSKNVDPTVERPELQTIVVAQNNVEFLDEIEINGEWVKVSKLIKNK